MNSGFGWSLLSSYTFFPFLPTLTTLYLINVPVVLPWYTLTAIGLVNLLGYVIYRLDICYFLSLYSTIYLFSKAFGISLGESGVNYQCRDAALLHPHCLRAG